MEQVRYLGAQRTPEDPLDQKSQEQHSQGTTEAKPQMEG